MKYHVLTPFARFQNLTRIIDMLRPFNIEWHPLFNDDLPFRLLFKDDWIYPSWFPSVPPPFWKSFNKALNWFVHIGQIVPEDYYLILNDDDFYEPEFFNKIRQYDEDAFVVSMKRGQHIPIGVCPERAHGTYDLIACPQNMKVGAVGAEQLVVKGKLLQDKSWPDDIAADGMLICYIAAVHGVKYVPDAFVWFNYLEPGRWD